MIGIRIEAGMTCPSCEQPIPLNALVSSVRCPACGDVHPMEAGTWGSLLEDALEEVPGFAEDEGRSATIFGTYSWRITYGRQQPRFEGTPEDIPAAEVLEGLRTGFVRHPETAAATSVRAVPAFCAELLAGVRALVGEDPFLLPGETEISGRENPRTGLQDPRDPAGPVAFQCPGCGASLIIEDSLRKGICSFCGTEAAMPDDLWSRLHPARKQRRWYLLLDLLSRPFFWEDAVLGAAAAPDGDLYLAVENPEGGFPVVARLRSDWTPVWIRRDLEAAPGNDGDGPGLLTDPLGNPLLPSSNGRDLLVLSREDGSLSRTIPADDPASGFTLEGCRNLAVLPDGTLFLGVNGQDETEPGDRLVFRRFDPEGVALPLWPPDPSAPGPRRTGLLARIRQCFSGVGNPSSDPERLAGIGSRPAATTEPSPHLFAGTDGALYLYADLRLAAFRSDGALRYTLQLAGGSPVGTPAALADGRVLILAEDEECHVRLMEISADGTSVVPLSLPGGDPGSLEDAEIIVPAPGGRLYLLGGNGFRKLLRMDETYA